MAPCFREAGLGFYAVEYPGYVVRGGAAAVRDRLLGRRPRWSTRTSSWTCLGSARCCRGSRSARAWWSRWRSGAHGSRLVLITHYTSIVDVGGQDLLVVLWLPASLLVRDPFDSAAKAPALKLPVLIIHGTRDEVIPVDMGQRLGTLFRTLPCASLKASVITTCSASR